MPYAKRDPVTLDELIEAGRDFATVPEVASILRCDPRTVNTSIRLGEIPAVRAGTMHRVPVSWLRQQVEAGAA